MPRLARRVLSLDSLALPVRDAGAQNHAGRVGLRWQQRQNLDAVGQRAVDDPEGKAADEAAADVGKHLLASGRKPLHLVARPPQLMQELATQARSGRFVRGGRISDVKGGGRSYDDRQDHSASRRFMTASKGSQ